MAMAQSVRMAQARRSKYRAQPTVVDGVRFASKREAAYYGELVIRQRLGGIRDLTLQPRYPLEVLRGMETFVIGEYVGDFAFEEWLAVAALWQPVVVDVKGFRTPLYRWKKRHVEAQYGIEIREVR